MLIGKILKAGISALHALTQKKR